MMLLGSEEWIIFECIATRPLFVAINIIIATMKLRLTRHRRRHLYTRLIHLQFTEIVTSDSSCFSFIISK
jgi:hypothetical protein